MTTSSASKRRTAEASCSLMIRGQSFSIRVISASIAALSGVASATAILALVDVLVGCGLAQPSCKRPAMIVAKTSVHVEKYLFISGYSSGDELSEYVSDSKIKTPYLPNSGASQQGVIKC